MARGALVAFGLPRRTTVEETVLTYRRAAGISFPEIREAVLALHSASIPVLCAFSEDDPIIGTDTSEALVEALGPTARTLRVKHGGHYLPKHQCRTIAKMATEMFRNHT
jgi:pimeloyl-ACP methyl ester carboxylesterase